MLVNAELQILQFRGDTGAYLKPASGQASFSLLKMAREGLMVPLRALLTPGAGRRKHRRAPREYAGETGTAALTA